MVLQLCLQFPLNNNNKNLLELMHSRSIQVSTSEQLSLELIVGRFSLSI